jgi:starch phosphorylase
LPLYAGGLGVLAGDMLKTASDLGVPMIGIGLFYGRGYFRQRVDADGGQHTIYPANDPATLPIIRVNGPDGEPVTVALQLPGREVRLRAWLARVGRVQLYLLDSNDPWNAVGDRAITSTLYGGDAEQRLLQEIALGIGGWRLLDWLGVPVDICHLNEGHAALAAVERARRRQRAEGLTFQQALWATRVGNVFTTHTPVAAGFDLFPRKLVLRYARSYAESAGVDESALLALGQAPGADHDHFNMAWLAARCCARVNAVSRRHGETSRWIFAPLYPRWPLAQVPITHVTNGVHVPSWDSAEADRLWTETCGADRWLGDTEKHEALTVDLGDAELWSLRQKQREAFVHFARHRLRQQREHSDAGADAIAAAGSALDPDLLTLGFARRFTEYKRPTLLLADPERLARLLLDPRRPVQLVVAGKAHPDDPAGAAAISEWVRFARRPELRSRVVFIEDYDLLVAEQLVRGVDVWINTPREPWEACGTSGMKVLVNGGLNLSVLDGWWAEAWSPEVGWALASGSDAQQADKLLERLESEIAPLFYMRDASGLPCGWIARVRASLSRLTPQFSANRMLLDYVNTLYRPATAELAERQSGDSIGAKELATREARLRAAWPEVRLGRPQHSIEAGRPRICVDAWLGPLDPAELEVQLYADASAERPLPFVATMSVIESGPGRCRYALDLPPAANPEQFTPRIVPRLETAHLPQELELIRWP